MNFKETEIEYECLSPQDEGTIIGLIRQNLESFEEAGSVIASTFRRLDNFYESYSKDGSIYLVVKETQTNQCIGGAGLGPLAGLHPAEGIGEIRDMFISKPYRGHGLGAKLLQQCLEAAIKADYRRLYLETTPEMEHAQKLFKRFGFRPVTQNMANRQKPDSTDGIPCYYMLEELKRL